MRAPALRRRVTLTGIAVLVGVLVAFNVFVYASLRTELVGALDELLDERMDVAAGLADELGSAELADRLTAVAVPARITSPGGDVFHSDPATPRVGTVGPPTAVPSPRVERTAELADGTTVTVFATRAGVQATLRRLLLVMVLGTAVAVVLAVLLWRRASTALVAPLTQMADTAVRITAGEAAQRLAPDRDDTTLGRLATAFDEMVDAQQRALEVRTPSGRRRAASSPTPPTSSARRWPASAPPPSNCCRRKDPELRDRLLANVVRETARASRLVTALLRMAQLEHRELRREPTDLVELCRQELERARSLAPHLRIDLAPWPGQLQDQVEVDREAVQEALANLLDNARRHADTTVRLVLAGGERTVTVRVKDDGPGIAPEDRERVFERFSSLDGKGGSGLGLPIARSVARHHGGDLVYEEGAFVLWVTTSEPPPASATG